MVVLTRSAPPPRLASFQFPILWSLAYSLGMTVLQRNIEDSVAATRALSNLEKPLGQAVNLVVRCLTTGHKLLGAATAGARPEPPPRPQTPVCGNGGSASDATHLATEFLCRFCEDRRPYPAISLTANGEFMTAVGNDYHFDEVFARQVWGLG